MSEEYNKKKKYNYTHQTGKHANGKNRIFTFIHSNQVFQYLFVYRKESIAVKFNLQLVCFQRFYCFFYSCCILRF